jgi:hypothetical protein
MQLFWVFTFITAAYIYSEGKKVWPFFVGTIFYIWAADDFINLMGMVWAVGGFLMILYISRLAILAFAETFPSLQNKYPLIFFLHFWATLFVFNIFLR